MENNWRHIKWFYFISLLFLILFACGCTEKKTNDPIKAFQYWSGRKPPEAVKVINASYWQSSHWSKEYILYLKMVTSEKWRSDFIKQNGLVKDTSAWDPPTGAPTWFTPPANFERWRLPGDMQGSRLFTDPKSGMAYHYEIQL